jgi:hypothetical protein
MEALEYVKALPYTKKVHNKREYLCPHISTLKPFKKTECQN